MIFQWMIQVTNLQKSYHLSKTLNNINFFIPRIYLFLVQTCPIIINSDCVSLTQDIYTSHYINLKSTTPICKNQSLFHSLNSQQSKWNPIESKKKKKRPCFLLGNEKKKCFKTHQSNNQKNSFDPLNLIH